MKYDHLTGKAEGRIDEIAIFLAHVYEQNTGQRPKFLLCNEDHYRQLLHATRSAPYKQEPFEASPNRELIMFYGMTVVVAETLQVQVVGMPDKQARLQHARKTPLKELKPG